MKLGIMGTRGIPNRYGGFEQFTESLAAGLQRKGHEVYVYSPSHHEYKDKLWNNVNIIHSPDPEKQIGTAGQFIYDLNCIKDARKRNFDVLFHFGYSSDSYWWKRWPKTSVNITNMDGLEWKRTKYNTLTRAFLKKAESWAANHSDLLIADSLAMRDYIFKTYNKDAIFIPYGAEIFSEPDATILRNYDLQPDQYYLLIARMEPENNIEMIIEGWITSGNNMSLVVIGNTSNKYGKLIKQKLKHPQLRFEGAVYDKKVLNNLRTFSALYFHGHSVGGTNPSLLEAMACGCKIVAHDNAFNRAVLGDQGQYFICPNDIGRVITRPLDDFDTHHNIRENYKKIRTLYNPQKIIDAYEKLILEQANSHQTP